MTALEHLRNLLEAVEELRAAASAQREVTSFEGAEDASHRVLMAHTALRGTADLARAYLESDERVAIKVELLRGFRGTEAIGINDYRIGPDAGPWTVVKTWTGEVPMSMLVKGSP